MSNAPPRASDARVGIGCTAGRSPSPSSPFPFLYAPPWNPIYAGVAGLALGAGATALCRRDLAPKTLVGAALFIGYYAVFLLGLQLTAPAGYVERVWNVADLSGLQLAGAPVEELMFAAAFGAYWAGVYERFTWRSSVYARR